MNILALDTADEVFSAALATVNGLWYTEADAGSRHSELIMECTDTLCRTAGLSQKDINLVACMKGPGSFTGLRIGFSAAKGICLALGIPLVAINTLDCLSFSLSVWPGIVVPVLDAKRNCFFTALYRDGKRLTDYADASVEDITNLIKKNRISGRELTVLTGSGAEIVFPLLSELIPKEFLQVDPGFRRGRARELLEIAKYSILNDVDDNNSGPVYLRKSDAEMNRDKNRN